MTFHRKIAESVKAGKKLCFSAFSLLIILRFSAPNLWSNEPQDFNRYEKIVDLRGVWKFAIGDESQWSDAAYNDSAWSDMFVPADWEDEGYAGYDGIAWYRKVFRMSGKKHEIYSLMLGYIDDSDEVWINGHFVGRSGDFPPGKGTAFDQFRNYIVPAEYIKFNSENVIAVRVYDRYLNGGIVNGSKIGIFVDTSMLIPLSGEWQFKTIDYDLPNDFINENSQNWHRVFVPKYWDEQGFGNYDGFGWYRKSVVIPAQFKGEALILVLGRIDDFDETYINGHLIGRTGFFSRYIEQSDLGDTYLIVRIYDIPPEIIHFGGENTIDVRVYDGHLGGGIYDGPVGITTSSRFQYNESEYIELKYQDKESIWDVLRDIFEN